MAYVKILLQWKGGRDVRTEEREGPRMCALGTATGLAILILALAVPALRAQGSGDAISLFDGSSLAGWVVENSDDGNFSVRDGAIRVAEPGGWLRFDRSLSDFQLNLEFRLVTDGADSGVFVRAAAVDGFIRGWPNQSYQVQLRDMDQPSNFLPLGGVYRHGMGDGPTEHDHEAVATLYRGVGAWHTLEIEAVGDRLVVRLDGTRITSAEGIANERGYIGFQGEIGAVEYRNIRIRELD